MALGNSLNLSEPQISKMQIPLPRRAVQKKKVMCMKMLCEMKSPNINTFFPWRGETNQKQLQLYFLALAIESIQSEPSRYLFVIVHAQYYTEDTNPLSSSL